MKPIIFSTLMVQAILDGRKTQTRRVIKAPVLRNVREPDEVLFDGKICKFNWHGDDVIGGFEIKPKYQPGDILWVRETWSRDESGEYVYRTNYGTTEDDSFPPSMFRWRPSIHMPREAARIFLLTKAVWPEKLQDITEKNAIAEGVQKIANGFYTADNIFVYDTAKAAFKALWDEINTRRGYPYSSNPWVWVYEFEKISKEDRND